MDTYTLPILLEGEHWTLTSVRLNAFIIFGEARQGGAALRVTLEKPCSWALIELDTQE